MRQYIFKPTRTIGGKDHVSKYWHGSYLLDGEAKERRLSLQTTDKQVARQKLQQIVNEKQRQACGLAPSEHLQEGAKLGLAEHLRNFLADLEAKGRDEKYCYNLEKRSERLFRECAWNYVKDVSPAKFTAW